MKKVLIALLFSSQLALGTVPPLTNPLIRDIDGLPGLMDAKKIESTLWMIKEIKNIHNGVIKVSPKGEPDPTRTGVSKELVFRGKKQTIKSLVKLEEQLSTFSVAEKAEFKALFAQVKKYFGMVNMMLLVDSRGVEELVFKLMKEFCQKRNRQDSFLLTWKKGQEMRLYEEATTSFKIFYVSTLDIMNFLADFVMSCPKAMKAYKESR